VTPEVETAHRLGVWLIRKRKMFFTDEAVDAIGPIHGATRAMIRSWVVNLLGAWSDPMPIQSHLAGSMASRNPKLRTKAKLWSAG